MLLGQPYMSHIYKSCQPDDYDNSMCFQVLGFDIMIDKYFKPWLIEVNASPSFATDSPLDYDVKKSVIGDAFELLALSQERREQMVERKQTQMAERILTGKLDKVDPETKKRLREERLAERNERERQMLRSGGDNQYELIFPSTYEEEKNPRYEELLKRANELWDEFTTGAKGKKRQDEIQKEKDKQEAEKRKAARIKKQEAKAKQQAAMNQTLEPLRAQGALSRQGSQLQGSSNAQESVGAYVDCQYGLGSQKSVGSLNGKNLKNNSSGNVDMINRQVDYKPKEGGSTNGKSGLRAVNTFAPQMLAGRASVSEVPTGRQGRAVFSIKDKNAGQGNNDMITGPNGQLIKRTQGVIMTASQSGDFSLNGCKMPIDAHGQSVAAPNPQQQKYNTLQRNALEQQQAKRRAPVTVGQQTAHFQHHDLHPDNQVNNVVSMQKNSFVGSLPLTSIGQNGQFNVRDGGSKRRLQSVNQQKQIAASTNHASSKAQMLTPMRQPSQKASALGSFDKGRYQQIHATDGRAVIAQEERLAMTQSFSNHSGSTHGSRRGHRQANSQYNPNIMTTHESIPNNGVNQPSPQVAKSTLAQRFLQNQHLINHAHLLATPNDNSLESSETSQSQLNMNGLKGFRPSRMSLSKRPDRCGGQDEGYSLFQPLPDFRQQPQYSFPSGMTDAKPENGGQNPYRIVSGGPSGNQTIVHSACKSNKNPLGVNVAQQMHYTPQQKLNGGAKFTGLLQSQADVKPLQTMNIHMSNPVPGNAIGQGIKAYPAFHSQDLSGKLNQPPAFAGNLFVNGPIMAAGPWRGPNMPLQNGDNEATAKFGSMMADKGLVGPPRQSDITRPFNLAPAAFTQTGTENIFMQSSQTRSIVRGKESYNLQDKQGRITRHTDGAQPSQRTIASQNTTTSMSGQGSKLHGVNQSNQASNGGSSSQMSNTSYRVESKKNAPLTFSHTQDQRLINNVQGNGGSLLRGKAGAAANYAQMMMGPSSGIAANRADSTSSFLVTGKANAAGYQGRHAGIAYQNKEIKQKGGTVQAQNQRGMQAIRHYQLDGMGIQRNQGGHGVAGNSKRSLQTSTVGANGRAVFSHVGAGGTPSRRTDQQH